MSDALNSSFLERKPFRFYARFHWRMFTLGLFTLFLTNVCDSLSPLAVKAAIDHIQGHDPHALLQAIFVYLALMGGWSFFRFWWRAFWGQFHHTVAEDLRNRIFAKLTVLGPTFYHRNPVGQLMSLITNDVNSFRMAIGPGLLILFDAVFQVAIILPAMIFLSWSWTWKCLILLPLIPPFMRKMENLMHARFRVEQDRLSEVSANAQEIVSGVRVIKAYAQESHQLASFDVRSKSYEEACNRVAKLDAVWQPVMEFSVAAGTSILLFFCTEPVMQGTITLGTFFAFQDYIRRMIWPMSALGFGASMLEQGRASFDRVRDLLQTSTDIPDNGTTSVSEFERLEIRDLSFQFAGAPAPALSGVSFEILAGETVGVVGPVGAGKTTLLQILCRLYPVESGRILLNGVSIEKIKQSDLRRLISLVPQDTFLFSDTIAENMALGIDWDVTQSKGFATSEDVRHFAQVVNIEAEIESLPSGYDAMLGERGVNLSGGQKQRLAIARALIRNSQIVILDDSLSAVDGKTERSIVAQLRGALEKRTVILVSHRLATLKHADRIIVLNQGSIEAIGTHEELLVSCDTYRHIDELQGTPTVDDAIATLAGVRT